LADAFCFYFTFEIKPKIFRFCIIGAPAFLLTLLYCGRISSLTQSLTQHNKAPAKKECSILHIPLFLLEVKRGRGGARSLMRAF
jgi:hypothetical protein